MKWDKMTLDSKLKETIEALQNPETYNFLLSYLYKRTLQEDSEAIMLSLLLYARDRGWAFADRNSLIKEKNIESP